MQPPFCGAVHQAHAPAARHACSAAGARRRAESGAAAARTLAADAAAVCAPGAGPGQLRQVQLQAEPQARRRSSGTLRRARPRQRQRKARPPRQRDTPRARWCHRRRGGPHLPRARPQADTHAVRGACDAVRARAARNGAAGRCNDLADFVLGPAPRRRRRRRRLRPSARAACSAAGAGQPPARQSVARRRVSRRAGLILKSSTEATAAGATPRRRRRRRRASAARTEPTCGTRLQSELLLLPRDGRASRLESTGLRLQLPHRRQRRVALLGLLRRHRLALRARRASAARPGGWLAPRAAKSSLVVCRLVVSRRSGGLRAAGPRATRLVALQVQTGALRARAAEHGLARALQCTLRTRGTAAPTALHAHAERTRAASAAAGARC